MKNIGKVFNCFLIILLSSLYSYAADIETELEDRIISVGESTTLRVKLSGGTSEIKPRKYPKVSGLKISYSGMQRSFQFVNGKSWIGIELFFNITALKKGRYRIPSFVFERDKKRFKSREVTLVVTKGVSGESSVAAQDIKSKVEISTKKAYIGEPVIMRYYILSSGVKARVRGFEESPDTKGFVIKEFDDHMDDKISADYEGDYVKTHISSFALIPAGAGNYKVGGGTAVISVENPRINSRRNFGGFPFSAFPQQKKLFFDKRSIKVVPFPKDEMPDDFHGDIGVFTIDADYSPEPLKVYEEKRVIVTIEGRGNLITMTKPALENEIEDLKVISEDVESAVRINGDRISGKKKIVFTFIPEKSGRFDLGRFKFTFFNPESKEYQTIKSKNISFKAKGDVGKNSRIKFDDNRGERLDFNPLYFVIILLIIAGGIAFVVMWERKRYRIVAGSIDDKREDEAREKIEKSDYFSELTDSLKRGDSNIFVSIAEKALDQIKRSYSKDGLPDDILSDIDRVKDKVYGYRFGGGKISGEDMKIIFQEISSLKKH